MVAPTGETPEPYLEAVLDSLRHAEEHLVVEAPELAERIRQLRVRLRRKVLGI